MEFHRSKIQIALERNVKSLSEVFVDVFVSCVAIYLCYCFFRYLIPFLWSCFIEFSMRVEKFSINAVDWINERLHENEEMMKRMKMNKKLS